MKQREERTGPRRIKWWRFRENKGEMISLTRLPTITNVEGSWNQMKDTIHKAASATLGVTKPGKRYINRDIWEAKKTVAVIRAEHYKNLYDKLDTRDGERSVSTC